MVEDRFGIVLPPAVIGIVGAGQLGRMLAFSAHRLGYRVAVLTGGAKQTPAGAVADVEIAAPFDDADAIEQFVTIADVITWEAESVNRELSRAADVAGVPVRPNPRVMAATSDRSLEKQALLSVGVPVVPYREASNPTELATAVATFRSPVIIKTVRSGYDGKGQIRLDPEAQARETSGDNSLGVSQFGSLGLPGPTGPGGSAMSSSLSSDPASGSVAARSGRRGMAGLAGFGRRSRKPPQTEEKQIQPSGQGHIDAAFYDLIRRQQESRLIVEKEIPFDLEASVVVARTLDGSLADHGVMENVVKGRIIDTTVTPPALPPEIAAKAISIAHRLASHLDVVGILCAEMFIVGSELIVNEIATRPHNSAHLTVEAASASQFEQHIRAICGLPLGDGACQPAAMAQLLGDFWADGQPDWVQVLSDPGIHLHLYGKQDVMLRRKMGHLTCVDSSPEQALERVLEARAQL